ncbi:MAG: pirin family protein [Flavobacteriaceae bacterium]
MKLNTIKHIGRSDLVQMGAIQLRQPIPSKNIERIDPFILLHHYGPYEISRDNNPFDLGPHPHRGFEPITFLIQGEQLHRDSLGNSSIVKAGDVQWTTSGRGIIHAEGPTKEFIEKGGVLEGIQLWLNLPSEKKLMQPKYQHVAFQDFNSVSEDGNKVSVQVIAGEYNGVGGKITTQTPVNTYMIDMQTNGMVRIPINKLHQSMLYLLKGNVLVNETIELKEGKSQLIEFNNDGDEIVIRSKENSKLLFLSGEPLNEKVASYGPYVMNTQTELLEAMRDYQQGKMGFLPISQDL